MSDIAHWLERHGLGKYAAVFVENEIDLEILPELDEADLEKLGLPMGPRKKLRKAIGEAGETGKQADVEPSAWPAPSRSSSSEAERRQLTIMFADMVGSTELSHTLDPEDLREVNRAYQDAVKATVERYGGYVARYMGDGVLAYFGYPQAHEDDAERAIRAGLDLTEVVPTLSSEVTLAVRVGIATGPVVVGDLIGEGASQESAAVGETPNLAARLQSIAPPNSTVIGSTTRRLVAGRFEMTALEGQRVKGIAEPVPVFRVDAVREVESRFDATPRRQMSPLIGRDDELDLMRRRWNRVVAGEFQLVLISGEPGIGKSRLTRAVREIADEDEHITLLFQCSPFYASSSFRPFVENIRRAAKLKTREPPAQQLAKIEVVLRRSVGFDTEDVPLFGALLGIQCELPLGLRGSEERRRRTLRGLVRQLKGLAQHLPVLCVFEDIHWADPSTLDVLSSFIEQATESPVMLLATYRPEFSCPWVGRARSTSIVLNRMTPRETAELIEAISAIASRSPELVTTIVDRTDGVPLFVEELTQALIELDGAGGLASCHDLTARDSIPSSLHDALMERLDRLGTAKDIAQAGAIFGREFTRDQVESVCDLPPSAVDEALEALRRSELVFRRRDGEGGSRYVFKHALVREAAHQSLLQSRRQVLHERAAGMLERSNAPREVIASHYEQAGRVDEAVHNWHMAARGAGQESAYREALAHLENALRHFPGEGREPERERHECDLQIDLARNLANLDRFDDAFNTLERAEHLARDLDDPLRLSMILHNRGNLWFPLGRIDKCLADQELSRAEAQRGHSVAMEARALGGLCDAHYLQGQIVTAHARAEEAVRLAEENGLKGVLAGYLGMRGLTRGYLLRLSDAIADTFRSVEIAEDLSRYRSAVVSLQIGGYFLLETGDQAAAKAALVRGLDLAHDKELGRFEPISLLFLAKIHWSEGNHEQARLEAEKAKRISEMTAPNFTSPWVIGTLLGLATTNEQREALCAEAEQRLRDGCVSHNHLWFHRDAIDTWLSAGDAGAALRHADSLEQYTADEPLPWSNFYIRRARALAKLQVGDDVPSARREVEALIAQAHETGLLAALPMMNAALEGRAPTA